MLVLSLPISVNATTLPGCLDAAARHFDITPGLLSALLRQESGGRCPGRHRANRDGSHDIGCMGINSSWLPLLTRRFGITEARLHDPCTNVHVAAWIHAHNVRRHGDTWRAVGAYNAVTETKRMDYAWKIAAHMARAGSSR